MEIVPGLTKKVSSLPMSPLHTHNITLGTCLRFLGVALTVILILFYVQYQARNILLGPTIHLDDAYEIIHHDRLVTLHGTARNIVKLSLNGKEIHTNEHGEFTQTVILENGYTITQLEAKDRFGRTTSLVRPYVYVPATDSEHEV